MITAAWRAGSTSGHTGWKLKFGNPWDTEKLEALKAIVPAQFRSYDPELQEWWVSIIYQDVLLGIFGGEFEPYLRQLPLL